MLLPTHSAFSGSSEEVTHVHLESEILTQNKREDDTYLNFLIIDVLSSLTQKAVYVVEARRCFCYLMFLTTVTFFLFKF